MSCMMKISCFKCTWTEFYPLECTGSNYFCSVILIYVGLSPWSWDNYVCIVIKCGWILTLNLTRVECKCKLSLVLFSHSILTERVSRRWFNVYWLMNKQCYFLLNNRKMHWTMKFLIHVIWINWFSFCGTSEHSGCNECNMFWLSWGVLGGKMDWLILSF